MLVRETNARREFIIQLLYGATLIKIVYAMLKYVNSSSFFLSAYNSRRSTNNVSTLDMRQIKTHV